jgi:hypothetical protein
MKIKPTAQSGRHQLPVCNPAILPESKGPPGLANGGGSIEATSLYQIFYDIQNQLF